MKKFSVLVVCLVFVATPLVAQASAGVISPSSKAFFLQTWGESIKYLFTFSKENRINYLIELSNRRVSEIAATTDTKTLDTLTRRYDDYYQTIATLTPKVTDNKPVTDRIQTNNLRQQEVLARVYEQVPEQAKDAIVNAQTNSAKHVGETVEKVEGSAAATDYHKQVQVIQQARKVGQVPMQSDGPSADPSQNTPRALNSANGLNSLNEINNTGSGDGQGSGAMPRASQISPQ